MKENFSFKRLFLTLNRYVFYSSTFVVTSQNLYLSGFTVFHLSRQNEVILGTLEGFLVEQSTVRRLVIRSSRGTMTFSLQI